MQANQPLRTVQDTRGCSCFQAIDVIVAKTAYPRSAFESRSLKFGCTLAIFSLFESAVRGAAPSVRDLDAALSDGYSDVSSPSSSGTQGWIIGVALAACAVVAVAAVAINVRLWRLRSARVGTIPTTNEPVDASGMTVIVTVDPGPASVENVAAVNDQHESIV
jgi:hypothetical protein